jgi:hypothetical protein
MSDNIFGKLARGEVEPDLVIQPEMVDFSDESDQRSEPTRRRGSARSGSLRM